MSKKYISAIMDENNDVVTNFNWNGEKEKFYILSSLFSSLIKIIGKNEVYEMVEWGDKLREKEDKLN